ncbi:hypothetical protein [Aureivirga sp. CE67]|uniref:hypothetical protein n=1 Tax=Aureivirga sp. CE67 TaxID=1788983 RepID=UPI0018CA9845|nr:hypothetical protein [Aureivirga sp. CE67]
MKYRYLIVLFVVTIFSCKKTVRKNIVETENKNESSKELVDYECTYDNKVNSLGKGLVILPTSFEIYKDSLLLDKQFDLDMYADEVELCSKYHKPDYGIMQLVCLEETDKSYKVIVNHVDIKYVPKTEEYIFVRWNDYIMNSFGIRRKDKNQPIYIEANKNSEKLDLPTGLESLCPLEVKNDWVKVRWDCFYNDQDGVNEERQSCHDYTKKCGDSMTGWLKWRTDSEINIGIFITT